MFRADATPTAGGRAQFPDQKFRDSLSGTGAINCAVERATGRAAKPGKIDGFGTRVVGAVARDAARQRAECVHGTGWNCVRLRRLLDFVPVSVSLVGPRHAATFAGKLSPCSLDSSRAGDLIAARGAFLLAGGPLVVSRTVRRLWRCAAFP
eukprot:g11596.t1